MTKLNFPLPGAPHAGEPARLTEVGEWFTKKSCRNFSSAFWTCQLGWWNCHQPHPEPFSALSCHNPISRLADLPLNLKYNYWLQLEKWCFGKSLLRSIWNKWRKSYIIRGTKKYYLSCQQWQEKEDCKALVVSYDFCIRTEIQCDKLTKI